MKQIHLLVEDDYIETFIAELPKGKATVIEKDFTENQEHLKDGFSNYLDNKSTLLPYYESMKELSIWLKEREL